jgi:hypothetical protein
LRFATFSTVEIKGPAMLNKTPKFNIPVRIDLSGGASMYCVVFVRQNQRIIEMLGDERTFIPVQTNDGVSLVNKAHILRLEIMTKTEIKEKSELFPNVNFYYLDNNSW